MRVFNCAAASIIQRWKSCAERPAIRAGHRELVHAVIIWLFRLEHGGNVRREPRRRMTCGEISSWSPNPMGAAAHVIHSSGPSKRCKRRHFWAAHL
eukprot:5428919-Pyramimonas_sp.AAC.1